MGITCNCNDSDTTSLGGRLQTKGSNICNSYFIDTYVCTAQHCYCIGERKVDKWNLKENNIC